MFLYILVIFIVLNIVCDINYLVRTFISVGTGKFYQRRYDLNETTSMYGICTLQDCDITFKHIRTARVLRDLDFARYHFYERTGIYQRSRELGIKSLQGCTLTVTDEPVPLFSVYKINTKLVFCDECSLFLEHEVITVRDGRTRSILVSRQHAIGPNGASTEALLAGLPGSSSSQVAPLYLRHWLKSMQISSEKLMNECNK